MNGRIEHRAARVSLVNGLSTVLTVAFQLISVPVCLRYWGQRPYGSWLALFSAFMLLRSLDAGFVAYVGNRLNYLYHQNTKALREHLASAVVGIVITSCLQLLLAAGTLAFEPLAALLGVSGAASDALASRVGLLLLIISWVLTGSYLGIVHRLLVPAGMMYQAAWWAMGFQVAQFAAIMIAAMLGLDMVQTSLLFAIAQLGIYLASAIYIRRKLPRFEPWLQGIRLRTGLSDLGQSVMMTGSNLVQQAATNGAVLMVAAYAGPVAVPIFTTIRTLTNLWTSVTTVLTTPLLPEVVRIHATGETHKLVPINQAFWVTVGSLVNWGALLSYPLVPFLYQHWTGHAVNLNQPLLCLMLAAVVLTNTSALMTLHLTGLNRLSIVLSVSLARAVLCLGVGAVGYSRLGLVSFGIGILAGELAAALLTGWYFVGRELARSGATFKVAAFGPVLLSTGTTLLFLTGAAFSWWPSPGGWLMALAGVCLATVWGWRLLDAVLRTRFLELAGKLWR